MSSTPWTMNCVIFGAKLFLKLYRGQISKEKAIAEIRDLSGSITEKEAAYLLGRVHGIVFVEVGKERLEMADTQPTEIVLGHELQPSIVCPDCKYPLKVINGMDSYTIEYGEDGNWHKNENPSELSCGNCQATIGHQYLEEVMKAVDLL